MDTSIHGQLRVMRSTQIAWSEEGWRRVFFDEDGVTVRRWPVGVEHRSGWLSVLLVGSDHYSPFAS